MEQIPLFSGSSAPRPRLAVVFPVTADGGGQDGCPQLTRPRWTEGPLAWKQPLPCLVTPFSKGGGLVSGTRTPPPRPVLPSLMLTGEGSSHLHRCGPGRWAGSPPHSPCRRRSQPCWCRRLRGTLPGRRTHPGLRQMAKPVTLGAWEGSPHLAGRFPPPLASLCEFVGLSPGPWGGAGPGCGPSVGQPSSCSPWNALGAALPSASLLSLRLPFFPSSHHLQTWG